MGLGTDLVEVARFRLALDRQGERIVVRLFSDDERTYAGKQKDPAKSLAARFGAKEAVMKALVSQLGRESSPSFASGRGNQLFVEPRSVPSLPEARAIA